MTSAAEVSVPRRAGALVLGSSAVIAVGGWAALAVTAHHLGPAEFARFSVVWGTFFGIGGIFAGLQQEVTRSSVSAPAEHGRPVTWLGLGVGAATVAAIGVLAPLWGPAAFDSSWSRLVPAVLVGLTGLMVLTCVNGALAARHHFGRVSAVLVVDQLLRLLAIILVLRGSGSAVALAWAVTLAPFAWLPLLLDRPVRAALRTPGAESAAAFAPRAASAMASSGCAALLVAGFPLLAELTAREPMGAHEGAVFAALLVSRAPLLTPLYSLRPVILSWFLQPGDVYRRVQTSVGLILGGGVVLAVGVAVGGPWVQTLAFGDDFRLGAMTFVGLAWAATAVALITVTGIALASLTRQGAMLAGWAVAVAVTVLVLAVDHGEGRLVLSTVLGPTAGACFHLAALHRSRRN